MSFPASGTPAQCGYLDVGGSGNETNAHLAADGRITIMFCAFDQPALTYRIYGRGRAVLPQDARDHLGRMRWSHRRAAEFLGVAAGHLTLVLTGRRTSRFLLQRIMALGEAHQISSKSMYARKGAAS